MSWEDFDDGFSLTYDSDNEFGLEDDFDDGFGPPDHSDNRFSLLDDGEYYGSGSPDDPDGEFCSQGDASDGPGSGLQDDSDDGFSSQGRSPNAFCLQRDVFDGSGLQHDDSDDGFSLQGDDFDGPGLQDDDSNDGWSLQGRSANGSGLVDDSDDGFSVQGRSANGSVLVGDSGGWISTLQSDPFDNFGLEDDFSDHDGFGLVDDSDHDLTDLVHGFNHGLSLHDESFETPEAKWIKHYCNNHKILLVGEGDFSFAVCLARAFGSATNMIATSLDSYDFILRNYGLDAWINIASLGGSGCEVIHEVDAKTMADHSHIGSKSFDRIVFNFPLAGFNKEDSRQSEIRRHRDLVRRFFENARRLLSSGGEIHVVHKTNGFFREWRIEELAANCGLQTIEKAAFSLTDYPGYQNKYGFGGNKNFDCNPSMTYKFGLQTSFTNFSANQISWLSPRYVEHAEWSQVTPLQCTNTAEWHAQDSMVNLGWY